MKEETKGKSCKPGIIAMDMDRISTLWDMLGHVGTWSMVHFFQCRYMCPIPDPIPSNSHHRLLFALFSPIDVVVVVAIPLWHWSYVNVSLVRPLL